MGHRPVDSSSNLHELEHEIFPQLSPVLIDNVNISSLEDAHSLGSNREIISN